MTSPRHDRAGRAAALLRYEWIKLRSLRSTWLLIGILLGIMCAAGLDAAHAALRSSYGTRLDPVYGTVGITYAQYAALALGVVASTGEFATGSIIGSLLVGPRRLTLYAAKAIVTAGFIFVASATYATVNLITLRPVLRHRSGDATAATLIRADIGVGLYLALIALLALGLATAVRYSAGTFVLLGALFIGADRIINYCWLPEAGTNLVRASDLSRHPAWTGLLVLTIWVAVGLAAGAVGLCRQQL